MGLRLFVCQVGGGVHGIEVVCVPGGRRGSWDGDSRLDCVTSRQDATWRSPRTTNLSPSTGPSPQRTRHPSFCDSPR